MATPPSSPMCEICQTAVAAADMQELPCRHSFCVNCLSRVPGTLCPAKNCEFTRKTDIVVDEAEGAGVEESLEETRGQHVVFGAHAHSVLDLEERLRCDGRRGRFACANVARLTLACRHSLCTDCLSARISDAVAKRLSLHPRVPRAGEPPYCPLHRCANRLLRSEVLRICERSPKLASVSASVVALLPQDPVTCQPGQDEILVVSAVYGKEASTTKNLVVPKTAFVADVLSGVLQVQRRTRPKHGSSVPVFVKNSVDGGKSKFEALDLRATGKKAVKDVPWRDGVQLVLDPDLLLARKKPPRPSTSNSSAAVK